MAGGIEINLTDKDFEELAMDAYLRDPDLQAIANRQLNSSTIPRYEFGLTREQLSDVIYEFKRYIHNCLCEYFTRLRNYTPSQVMKHKAHILETKTVTEIPDNINVKSKRKSAHPNVIITKAYIEVNFNTETLHYPSLNPTKFPNGVDNILLLMTKGWNYYGKKRPPWGMWHGRYTCGWTRRTPNDFLEQIIEWYNLSQEGDTQMRAVLSPQYRAYGSDLTDDWGTRGIARLYTIDDK